MVRQIKLLTKVQVCNFMGINELRFSKDKTKKRRTWMLMGCWALLILMLCGYVGAAVYGYILLGLSDVIPMYLTVLASAH